MIYGLAELYTHHECGRFVVCRYTEGGEADRSLDRVGITGGIVAACTSPEAQAAALCLLEVTQHPARTWVARLEARS